MSKFEKIIRVLVALGIIVSMFPTAVFASEPAPNHAGDGSGQMFDWRHATIEEGRFNITSDLQNDSSEYWTGSVQYSLTQDGETVATSSVYSFNIKPGSHYSGAKWEEFKDFPVGSAYEAVAQICSAGSCWDPAPRVELQDRRTTPGQELWFQERPGQCSDSGRVWNDPGVQAYAWVNSGWVEFWSGHLGPSGDSNWTVWFTADLLPLVEAHPELNGKTLPTKYVGNYDGFAERVEYGAIPADLMDCGVVVEPPSCADNDPTIDPATMLVTGTANGENAVSWFVRRVSDGTVMDQGEGNTANYSFTGDWDTDYQVVFLNSLGEESTGCVFRFDRPAGSVCADNDPTIDPATMLVTGTANGENAVSWFVRRVSDGTVMDQGEGNTANYSFTGDWDTDYQVVFLNSLGEESTGCVFRFDRVETPKPECVDLDVNGDLVTVYLTGDYSQVDHVELEDEDGNIYVFMVDANGVATGTVPGAANKTLTTYLVMRNGERILQSELCTYVPEDETCEPWVWNDVHVRGVDFPGDPYGHGQIFNATSHCRGIGEPAAIPFQITLEVYGWDKDGNHLTGNFVSAFGFYGGENGEYPQMPNFAINGSSASYQTQPMGQYDSFHFEFQVVPEIPEGLEGVATFEVMVSTCFNTVVTGTMCNRATSGTFTVDPDAAAGAPPADALPEWAATSGTVTVLPGESLREVANRIGMSFETLLDLNYHRVVQQDLGAIENLPEEARIFLYDGMVLRTTWTPGFGQVHVAARGETLGSVAAAFGVSVDALISFNHLGVTTVFPGQVILIP